MPSRSKHNLQIKLIARIMTLIEMELSAYFPRLPSVAAANVEKSGRTLALWFRPDL